MIIDLSFNHKVLNTLGVILISLLLLLSIFSVYCCKVGSSYISLIFFLELFTIVLATFYINSLLKYRYIKYIFFTILSIVFFETISLYWSIDIKFGIKQIFIFISFLAIFIVSTKLVNSNININLNFVVKLYLLFFTLFLLFVILFRLYPNLELEFLKSSLSKIFINPNIIDGIFTYSRNNILDPNKSGVVFVNSNVAAAFIGINFFIVYGLYLRDRLFIYQSILFLSIIALIFNGSKSVFIILPTTLLLLLFFTVYKRDILKLIGVVLVLFTLSYQFLNKVHISSINQSAGKRVNIDTRKDVPKTNKPNTFKTIKIRLKIWKYAFREFFNKPLLGEGFGGWFINYSNFAKQNNLNPHYPPHNTLIYLWSQSGLFVVFSAIFFIFLIIKLSIRLLKSRVRELSIIGVVLFGAFSWVFIHGMITNFGLVGEEHMLILLAIILGIASGLGIKYKELINE